MRKKTLAAALTGALAFSLAGVAYADINDTTMDLTFSAKPGKSGTKKKPKPVALNLGIEGGTKSGTGKPSTSTALKIVLPKGFQWSGKVWPSKARCSVSKANSRGSKSVCPKGSKVGSGKVVAAGGDGSLIENIDVTAYVTTAGNLGLFLDADVPLPIAAMLEGKVSGRNINVTIPTAIQEPLPGVDTAITTLKFGLNAKKKIKGKTRGIVESTSCAGKWTLKFTNVLTDGQLTDTAGVACRK